MSTTKKRVWFPKKGVEKKTLKFASNIGRVKKGKRFAVLRSFLRNKNAQERVAAKKILRTYKNRTKVFNSFENLVTSFRKKNPSFEGVIIFGGTTKKHSAPKDLDFVFVGRLSQTEKKRFCELLTKETNIPANPFPVKLDIKNNPKAFDSLLSLNYLSSPSEWSVQNFVGPLSTKRLLIKSFNESLKRTKSKQVQ